MGRKTAMLAMSALSVMLLSLVLTGCSGGGASKGQTMPDMSFSEIHEAYLSEIALENDCTLTFACKVEHESGTLKDSELEFDLVYDGKILHMPLFDADTYIDQADGSVYEFTEEDKSKGRKEAGSVYSSNKIPDSGVELTIKLNRAGDVITGEATYEGGAMGKGNHQFWIYHYYSDTKLPENLVLKITGRELDLSGIRFSILPNKSLLPCKRAYFAFSTE